jgi:hypothetical protein
VTEYQRVQDEMVLEVTWGQGKLIKLSLIWISCPLLPLHSSLLLLFSIRILRAFNDSPHFYLINPVSRQRILPKQVSFKVPPYADMEVCMYMASSSKPMKLVGQYFRIPETDKRAHCKPSHPLYCSCLQDPAQTDSTRSSYKVWHFISTLRLMYVQGRYGSTVGKYAVRVLVNSFLTRSVLFLWGLLLCF